MIFLYLLITANLIFWPLYLIINQNTKRLEDVVNVLNNNTEKLFNIIKILQTLEKEKPSSLFDELLNQLIQSEQRKLQIEKDRLIARQEAKKRANECRNKKDFTPPAIDYSLEGRIPNIPVNGLIKPGGLK